MLFYPIARTSGFRDNRRSLQFSENFLVFTSVGPSAISPLLDLQTAFLMNSRRSHLPFTQNLIDHFVSPSSFHPLARSHYVYGDAPFWISATNMIGVTILS